jgi:hypothetical protein
MIVENMAQFPALVDDFFTQLTERVSFATSWIETFISPYIQ